MGELLIRIVLFPSWQSGGQQPARLFQSTQGQKARSPERISAFLSHFLPDAATPAYMIMSCLYGWCTVYSTVRGIQYRTTSQGADLTLE